MLPSRAWVKSGGRYQGQIGWPGTAGRQRPGSEAHRRLSPAHAGNGTRESATGCFGMRIGAWGAAGAKVCAGRLSRVRPCAVSDRVAGQTNTGPCRVDRNNGAVRQIFTVAPQRGLAVVRLLTCRNSYQTDNPTVRFTENNRTFAKVLVEGHEQAAIVVRRCEDFPIDGIAIPIPHPDNVMSEITQSRQCATPHAAIEQEFHAKSYATFGSTRS